MYITIITHGFNGKIQAPFTHTHLIDVQVLNKPIPQKVVKGPLPTLELLWNVPY